MIILPYPTLHVPILPYLPYLIATLCYPTLSCPILSYSILPYVCTLSYPILYPTQSNMYLILPYIHVYGLPYRYMYPILPYTYATLSYHISLSYSILHYPILIEFFVRLFTQSILTY